ncbi:MAG: Small-conductance mechanosensitive channel, MscC family [Candidatus Methanohalarchaeum thermophilum]|uniref:Small-conductance mechanosensitive channel, MscC family n=1 Tax=Methanohalarchaeum thermophilum TaxID=1903181 RepID=A0A1Q6DS74_METT1|nr:MAG: Small-conductance mechanosensitive channel, MscC family [Candidatus Methanohalarchaeum thermophilum]
MLEKGILSSGFIVTDLISEGLDKIRLEAISFLKNSGIKLLVAIAIVLIGYLVAKKTVKYLGRPVAKWLKRPELIKPFLRLLKYLIIFISILVALNVIGVNLEGILLSATVISVIIGIVIAPIATNFISGAFLLSERPYEVGDLIYLPNLDETGYVKKITISHTKLTTLEKTSLVVPNQRMRETDVINYSADDLRIRREIPFTISYDSSIEEAKKIATKSAKEVDGVISQESNISIMYKSYSLYPTVLVEEFADSGINLKLRYWLKNPYYLPSKHSKVSEKLFENLKESKVEIPYPHRVVLSKKESDFSKE